MRIDDEVLLEKTIDVIKANLNDCITAMNTEKGDTLLEQINAKAWYENTSEGGMFSFQNFVMYGVMEERVIEEGQPMTMEEVTMHFEVATVDEGTGDSYTATKRVRRYKNTLKHLMHKYHRDILGGIKFKVSGLMPATFVVNGQKFITAGISVKAVIG